MKKFPLIIFSLSLVSLTACTEYWWTRGQAPSNKKLSSMAKVKLEDAVTLAKDNTDEKATGLIKQAKLIDAEFTTLLAKVESDTATTKDLSDQFDKLKMAFIDLEQYLTVASKIPYSELSGQLRIFNEDVSTGKKIDAKGFRMFTARTISFLASEIGLYKK